MPTMQIKEEFCERLRAYELSTVHCGFRQCRHDWKICGVRFSRDDEYNLFCEFRVFCIIQTIMPYSGARLNIEPFFAPKCFTGNLDENTKCVPQECDLIICRSNCKPSSFLSPLHFFLYKLFFYRNIWLISNTLF